MCVPYKYAGSFDMLDILCMHTRSYYLRKQVMFARVLYSSLI